MVASSSIKPLLRSIGQVFLAPVVIKIIVRYMHAVEMQNDYVKLSGLK